MKALGLAMMLLAATTIGACTEQADAQPPANSDPAAEARPMC
ncbi:hypothetical protein [Brevundimonas sp.]